MTIPGSNVFVPDWPIYCKAVPGRSFKIKIAPSLGLPCPKQRFSSHLVTADPVEGFLLHIRMFIIFYKKMGGTFVKIVTFAHYRVFLFHFIRKLPPVRKLPGHLGAGRVIYVVF